MKRYTHTNTPNGTDISNIPFVPNVPNSVRVIRVFGIQIMPIKG
jgi:hypothetical protein